MKKIVLMSFLFSSINLAAMDFKSLMMIAALSLESNSRDQLGVRPEPSVRSQRAATRSMLITQGRLNKTTSNAGYKAPKNQGRKTFRKQGNDFRK